MPNYYDRTRKNRTPESETVMVCFRSRTFFEKPAHIREGSYDDMVRWEYQQDKKFIHFESVQLPAMQALVRGVIERVAFHDTLMCEMQDILESQDPELEEQYDLLDAFCNRVYASY